MASGGGNACAASATQIRLPCLPLGSASRPSADRASAGSWPASVRPRARRRQSVNASASAPGPGAAVSPLPMEPACCPTDCWLSCAHPQAPGSLKHRRWRTRLPREPSKDAGHDSADARIPRRLRLPGDTLRATLYAARGRDGRPARLRALRFGASRRSSLAILASGGGKACATSVQRHRKQGRRVAPAFSFPTGPRGTYCCAAAVVCVALRLSCSILKSSSFM